MDKESAIDQFRRNKERLQKEINDLLIKFADSNPIRVEFIEVIQEDGTIVYGYKELN